MKLRRMENKLKKVCEESIGAFEFLDKKEGAYCKKEDENGNVVQYAFITSDVCQLVLFIGGDIHNVKAYDWNNSDEESHKVISNFLSELSFRPLYEKGKPCEQKIAKEMWQLLIPQSLISENIKNYINEHYS